MNTDNFPGISWQQLLPVFCAAIAVYVLSLGGGFVWDDIPLLSEPSQLQRLENIPLFFKTGVAAGTTFGQPVPYYRPMFTLSLALEYALWGAYPLGYHLINILFHGLAALLVTLLAAELLRNRAGATVAGLLFAVHPVHAEAVAYIAARNELICTLFVLATLVLYCRYREKRTWQLWLLLLLFFFAALLTKEMAITLPILIFFCELLCFQSAFGRSLLRSLPFAGVAALYLLLRAAVLTNPSWDSPPLDVRIATSFTLMGDYLRLLVFPWPLRVLHDLPIRWSFNDPAVISWALIMTGLVVLLIYCWRRNPLFSFGGFWIIISLLPASGLPTFIKPAMIAERYLYLPSIGLALLAGLAVISVKSHIAVIAREKYFTACIGGLLCACAVLTAWQSRAWHDQEQFCLRMIADAPYHPLGYHELGNWYGKQQRYAEMASAYQVSLELTIQQQDRTGRAYLKRGEFSHAEREYMKVVNAKVASGRIYNNLGLALLGQGKKQEARTRFNQALELEPGNMEFRKNLLQLPQTEGSLTTRSS